MKITTTTIVRHKKSGLEYRLLPKGNDSYYLTPNDGKVPSGQMIYRNESELDELFEIP